MCHRVHSRLKVLIASIDALSVCVGSVVNRYAHLSLQLVGNTYLNVIFKNVAFLARVVAGNPHGLPNNQPYAGGPARPYVSNNAQDGGEEKVEDLPVAIGVPVEK